MAPKTLSIGDKVQLKDYMQHKFIEQEIYMKAKFDSFISSLKKLDKDINNRFTDVNSNIQQHQMLLGQTGEKLNE